MSSPIATPPPPPSPPLPTTLVEDVQQNNGTTKPVKSKTARPSAEPYVPPSRRSQTANKELPLSSPVSILSTNENKNEDAEEEEDEDEEEEEDWEKLLDGNENPLNDNLVEEVKL